MADTATVTIREMQGEDVEPLAEALDLPWYQINNRWKELLAGWREIFVADAGGCPAGTVSINTRPERPDMLHLFALDVAEAVRNRGIGTQLVTFVEEEARRRGLGGVYLEVAVWNTDARRLYERLGYVQQGDAFQNSWNFHREDGTVEERVEEMIRLVKRF